MTEPRAKIETTLHAAGECVVRASLAEGAAEVVVSFESASQWVDRDNPDRPGFGEKFLLENGYSTLSILPRRVANWYRDPVFIAFLLSRRMRRLLARFRRIHTMGDSMGAYGALAYADALSADNVIAFAAISTLNRQKAPWDPRYAAERQAYDWEGRFHDAAFGLQCPASVYVLCDPDRLDARHRARIAPAAGSRLIGIDLPGCKHAITETLAEAGILKAVVRACLNAAPREAVQGLVDGADIAAAFARLEGKKTGRAYAGQNTARLDAEPG